MTEDTGDFGDDAHRTIPARPATVAGPSLRARTDLRFAILVAAVLASSVVAFSVVCAALPSTETLFRNGIRPCLARIDPATAWITDPGDHLNTQTAMANACARPYFLHELGWIATGLMAELAVALLLYALHPWWPTASIRLPQWSRKVRLAGDENADVLKELNALAHQAGLSRSPLWLVDPYATTSGGRAYGLPGRPRVCVDMGLLIRYDLDRGGFRAVVRHELAHHHHRDIGRTYLTVSLWWAFVTTALAPCVLLSLCPQALSNAGSGLRGTLSAGADGKLAQRLVALAVLSAIAYLARNMILRARELHADTLAHTWDVTGAALPRVVRDLPWPPTGTARRRIPARWRCWAARVGTHPSPERRVAAMSDSARLLRTGAWEMAGLGLLTGFALHNLALLTGSAAGRYVIVALTLLALPFGVVLASSLASALAVANAVRQETDVLETAGPWRDVLVLPTALTTGAVGSQPFSLVAADMATVTPAPGLYALIGLVHLVILLPLALWTWSALRRLPAPGANGMSWTRTRVIITTAGAVWGPLWATWQAQAWYPAALTMATVDTAPTTGGTIGWYAALTGRLADAYFYYPLVLVRATPLLPVGLVLAWAVPLLLAGRRHRSLAPAQGTGRALAVGAAAGLAAVAAGIALPWAARAVLPPEVRRVGDPAYLLGSLPFPVVYADTYTAITALLQAAAVVATVLVCRRLRPVLGPLAMTVTAVLGTVGLYVSRGTLLCVAAADAEPDACGLKAFLPDADMAFHLRETVAWGVVAAVPAALLGTAVRVLTERCRRRPEATTDTERADTPRRWPRLQPPALGLLAMLSLACAAAGVPQDYRVWRPTAPVAAPRTPLNGRSSPASSSSDGTNDPCLLGSWLVSPARQRVRVEGSQVWLTGEGGTWTFRSDGTLIIDYGNEAQETATLHGRPVTLRASGSVTTHYRTAKDTIGYYGSAVRRPGELTLRVAGTDVIRESLTPAFTPDHYTCAGSTAHLSPTSSATDSPYELTLVRQSSEEG
ncbi:M48 family metalloprotease [Streptomyces sp. NPDC007901]|uniref:M48 family metalloprotease n=1 Tax=Streptomyces sp. NPDC007901 TaxID=3364785 RepID=UPI0036EE303F